MRRGDWSVACERWEAVRGAFPDEASGYARGAEALLEGGRSRVRRWSAFPRGGTFSGPRWRCAVRRRCERWEAVRAFPDHTGWRRREGYVFPERRGSYLRRAEVAMRRGDWGAAWRASIGRRCGGRFRTRRRDTRAVRRRCWRRVGWRRRKVWRVRRCRAFPSIPGVRSAGRGGDAP